MSYNNYMYAIDRSDEYLEHYGIKGMKWGVRKALERGDARSINRHFRKAQRKLIRLQKRATSGKKYARRAALMGTGALATGALTVGGVAGLDNALGVIGRRGHGVINRVIKPSRGKDYGQAFSSKMLEGRHHLSDWARQKPFETKANNLANRIRADASMKSFVSKNGQAPAIDIKKLDNANNKAKHVEAIGQLNNAKLLRAGSALATAGLAAGAGYNAYRAATTKRAARKAAEWEKAMKETFGTTGSTNKRARTKRHKR